MPTDSSTPSRTTRPGASGLRIVSLAAAHAADIEAQAAGARPIAGAIAAPSAPGAGDRFVKRAQARWRAGVAYGFALLLDGRVAGVASLESGDAGRSWWIAGWLAGSVAGEERARQVCAAVAVHARAALGLNVVADEGRQARESAEERGLEACTR